MALDERRAERRRSLEGIPDGAALRERRKQIRRQEEQERWEKFGSWVRDVRLASGRSQSACATSAGMQPAQWSRIESAIYGTPAEKIPSIAAALGTDASETYKAAGYENISVASPPVPKEHEGLATRKDIELLRDELKEIKALLMALCGSR